MMNTELLRQAGVDYEAGLARFMGDVELYEAVLSAFVCDSVFERAQAAFRAGDKEELFSALHEAKGASGNADLTAVYAEACTLVTLLRSDAYTDDELTADFRRFEAAYSRTRDGIKAALEG